MTSIISHLFTQPLTVQTIGATSVNSFGDQVIESLGAPVAVLGYLEQTVSVEHLVDRDTTVTTWQAFLPAETVIAHMDYINFQAQKFQVSGEPHYAFNPRTALVSHIVCKLVVVNG